MKDKKGMRLVTGGVIKKKASDLRMGDQIPYADGGQAYKVVQNNGKKTSGLVEVKVKWAEGGEGYRYYPPDQNINVMRED